MLDMSRAIVVKSNELINSYYKLSLNETKLILYLASKINRDDEDFRRYTFSYREIIELFGWKSIANGSYIPELVSNLMTKTLIIENPKAETGSNGRKKKLDRIELNWFLEAGYTFGVGTVTLCFNPKLKPYLLQLKSNFTSLELKYMLRLQSFYSFRIYELLKQYDGREPNKVAIPQRTIGLQELRALIGIEDQYHKYSHLKSRILTPCMREISAKTDIAYEMTEIKRGKQIEKVCFHLRRNHSPETARPTVQPELWQEALCFEDYLNMKLAKQQLPLISSNSVSRPLLDELQRRENEKSGTVEKLAARLHKLQQDTPITNAVAYLIGNQDALDDILSGSRYKQLLPQQSKPSREQIKIFVPPDVMEELQRKASTASSHDEA